MSDTHVTISLPSLGDGVTEASIGRWLVAVGDHVGAEEPVLEIATDKVDTEIPSPHAGTVIEILAKENDIVEVGSDLFVIAISTTLDSDLNADPDPQQLNPLPVPVARSSAHTPTSSNPQEARTERPNSTPATDPAADIAIADETADEVVGAPQRMPRIRQIIADRMLKSLQTTAQLTSVVEVDLADISRLRADTKAEFLDRTGTKLSFLPFFAKAAIEALSEHPILSATANPECTEITYFDGVNLGIAVDGPKGLLVPVIRNAHRLGIAELAMEIASLASKVRSGSISPDELTGGTFTLTNTGSRGALFDTPILNAPQSGILGTGSVVERVVPHRDAQGGVGIAIRPMAYLALTYDHRVVDGADAARFLTTIKQRLEFGFSTDDVLATTSGHL